VTTRKGFKVPAATPLTASQNRPAQTQLNPWASNGKPRLHHAPERATEASSKPVTVRGPPWQLPLLLSDSESACFLLKKHRLERLPE